MDPHSDPLATYLDSPPATDSELRRWRRLILIRDGVDGKARCFLCGMVDEWTRFHAHHIYPKSLFPSLALRLANGITLCLGCHYVCVHSRNPAYDVGDHGGNWRRHRHNFRWWNRLASQRRYNESNQRRVRFAERLP